LFAFRNINLHKVEVGGRISSVGGRNGAIRAPIDAFQFFRGQALEPFLNVGQGPREICLLCAARFHSELFRGYMFFVWQIYKKVMDFGAFGS